ncbi:hypothetical protein [Thermotoga neapolitana]|nr:hypothetical protein [Thermotoga neapolitana]
MEEREFERRNITVPIARERPIVIGIRTLTIKESTMYFPVSDEGTM